MAGLMTMNCLHDHYAGPCTSRVCSCDCHLTQAKLTAIAAELREKAHAAVKEFDRKPDALNTQAAIDALGLYLAVLNNA